MPRPLLSCLMVTADRPVYARRAIASFAAQTYEHRELVVLDNGAEPMEHLLADLPDAQVVYKHVEREEGIYIGALRNQSLDLAQGELIATQWDDDDWSHPTRLEKQVAVLEKGYDACTLPGTLMHVDSPEFFDHPFIGLLVDGVPPTIVHRRDDAIRYPNLRRTSDTTFLGQWRQKRYAILPRGTEHLYVRYFHGGNLWEQEHFVRRMRNTPQDFLGYLWHQHVRRDIRGHARFQLSAEARRSFELYLDQSRPFELFQHDPATAAAQA